MTQLLWCGNFHWCPSIVYDKVGYLQTVDTCAKMSMKKAIDEVKVQPDYATEGEVRESKHTSGTCDYMYLYALSTVGNYR